MGKGIFNFKEEVGALYLLSIAENDTYFNGYLTLMEKNQYFKKPSIFGADKFDGKHQYMFTLGDANLEHITVDSIFRDLESPCHLNFSHITVTNSFFIKLISVTGNNYSFQHCLISESVEVSKLDNLRIHFWDCTFENKNLQILECNNSSFSIARSIDLFSVNILKCKKSVFQLHADSCVEFSMKGNDTVNAFLYYCKNDLELDIESNEISEFLLESCKLKSINNEHSNFKELKIKNCEFDKITLLANIYTDKDVNKLNISNLIIEGSDFNELKLMGFSREDQNKLKVDELEIINSNNIIAENMYCRVLKFEGNEYSNMEFNNSELSNLEFKDFVNNGKFKFRHIKVNDKNKYSSLSLSNSVLSGIEFDRSFLHNFKNLTLEESTISGIVLHYFKPIKNKIIRNSKASTSAKIELCRELTSLMQAQNNSHYATTYRALEQNFRLKERFRQFKIFNSDTLILTLNKITNNHGTQPFLAFIGMIVLVFLYYLVLNREFSLNPTSPDALNIMTSNVSYFFKPFTFISEIKEIDHEFSFGFRLWDILYKILYAYLVYQFIAAFRKFNK